MLFMRGDQESRQSEMGWQRGAKEEGTLVTQTVSHTCICDTVTVGGSLKNATDGESRKFTSKN